MIISEIGGCSSWCFFLLSTSLFFYCLYSFLVHSFLFEYFFGYVTYSLVDNIILFYSALHNGLQHVFLRKYVYLVFDVTSAFQCHTSLAYNLFNRLWAPALSPSEKCIDLSRPLQTSDASSDVYGLLWTHSGNSHVKKLCMYVIPVVY
jgi:hypothetical protein